MGERVARSHELCEEAHLSAGRSSRSERKGAWGGGRTPWSGVSLAAPPGVAILPRPLPQAHEARCCEGQRRVPNKSSKCDARSERATRFSVNLPSIPAHMQLGWARGSGDILRGFRFDQVAAPALLNGTSPHHLTPPTTHKPFTMADADEVPRAEATKVRARSCCCCLDSPRLPTPGGAILSECLT